MRNQLKIIISCILIAVIIALGPIMPSLKDNGISNLPKEQQADGILAIRYAKQALANGHPLQKLNGRAFTIESISVDTKLGQKSVIVSVYSFYNRPYCKIEVHPDGSCVILETYF